MLPGGPAAMHQPSRPKPNLCIRGSPVSVQAYAGAYHDFDWPDLKRTERPEFTTASGVVPITGADPAARDDVLRRVPAFLAPYLTR